MAIKAKEMSAPLAAKRVADVIVETRNKNREVERVVINSLT